MKTRYFMRPLLNAGGGGGGDGKVGSGAGGSGSGGGGGGRDKGDDMNDFQRQGLQQIEENEDQMVNTV
jgi:hypothetical protein